MFHKITVRETCTKRTTYKGKETEFFEEASALNTEAAIIGLKKRILQAYVQLDGVCQHQLV
jgi:hypothetical protein